jgi:uncharacterized protein YndB with AHSA1/START domain
LGEQCATIGLHISPGGSVVEDRIEREVVIRASALRVWAALTEPAHLAEWFGDGGAEVEALRPGGRITFAWKEHGKARAVIEVVDPPQAFSYRWALRPDVDPGPGNSTLVEFTLREEGDVTVLRVVESGFRGLEWSEEERVRDVTANISGWAAELGDLVEYLERRAEE